MDLVIDGVGITALVTGAASGMGAATARALGEAGARVGLADLPSDALTKVADEVGGMALPCDVVDGEGVKRAFDSLASTFDAPRLLVNCAGIASGAYVLTRSGDPQPLERFQRVLAVNLIGTFNTIRIFASILAKQEPLALGERGLIINVSSIAAIDGLSGLVGYSASKGGVASMTLPLAREFGPLGIRTVAIAPGHFDTSMTQQYAMEARNAIIASAAFPKTAGDPKKLREARAGHRRQHHAERRGNSARRRRAQPRPPFMTERESVYRAKGLGMEKRIGWVLPQAAEQW
jgi:NAD(P)-dependent dehydrogenase (short-subunit alcohol dehydrogenase family)